MAEDGTERRLAAILSADVVGYSRLMGEDDAGTLAAAVKALTTELFARQATDAGLSRAEALRQTMIDMIDGGVYADEASGKAAFSYAHPIFWAPFTLVGDGGGARPSS